jgi:hypothetical protein
MLSLNRLGCSYKLRLEKVNLILKFLLAGTFEDQTFVIAVPRIHSPTVVCIGQHHLNHNKCDFYYNFKSENEKVDRKILLL